MTVSERINYFKANCQIILRYERTDGLETFSYAFHTINFPLKIHYKLNKDIFIKILRYLIDNELYLV